MFHVLVIFDFNIKTWRLSTCTSFITHAHLAAYKEYNIPMWIMWPRLLSNGCLSKWSLNVWKNGSNDSNVALPCDNAQILPRKHNGNKTIFDFFRTIDNINFYWKILSLGHFFQVVKMLLALFFINTLKHLIAGMIISWMVSQRI